MSENETNSTPQPLEVNITNDQKIRIQNVRVNGEILDAQGNVLTSGAGIELDFAQVASLGATAIQALANVWAAQQSTAQ